MWVRDVFIKIAEEPIFSKPINQYEEPPFEIYTKVLRRAEATAKVVDKWVSYVYIMGIIPHEFGKVAWFRPDLLPHHWYEYLNLMSLDPRAALVSRSFQGKYKV